MPSTIVQEQKSGNFPPLPGYFPLSAGKIFFFPPYDSCLRLSTLHGRSTPKRAEDCQPLFFPPPPPPSDPTLSPSFAHRPETTPFVRPLPNDPIDHPPPWRRSPLTAVDATTRRLHTTLDEAMPLSPNGIVRRGGRTKGGKRVRVPARVAHQQEHPPAKKRSFSRDDRLARDGARLFSATTSSSSMASSPSPARMPSTRLRCVLSTGVWTWAGARACIFRTRTFGA